MKYIICETKLNYYTVDIDDGVDISTIVDSMNAMVNRYDDGVELIKDTLGFYADKYGIYYSVDSAGDKIDSITVEEEYD